MTKKAATFYYFPISVCILVCGIPLALIIGRPVTGLVIGFFAGLTIGVIMNFIEDIPNYSSYEEELDLYSKVPFYFIQVWTVGLRHFFEGVIGCLGFLLIIFLLFGGFAFITSLICKGY